MKFCDHHWAMLRTAIDQRGLTQFVQGPDQHATTMQAVVEAMQGGNNDLARQLEREAPYDPLWSALWMIQNRALEQGGLYMMTGDHCPVCEAMKHLGSLPLEPNGPAVGEAFVEQEWINGPADAAHQECIRRGLLGNN